MTKYRIKEIESFEMKSYFIVQKLVSFLGIPIFWDDYYEAYEEIYSFQLDGMKYYRTSFRIPKFKTLEEARIAIKKIMGFNKPVPGEVYEDNSK